MIDQRVSKEKNKFFGYPSLTTTLPAQLVKFNLKLYLFILREIKMITF